MSNRTFHHSHQWKIAWRETMILLCKFRRLVFTFAITIIGLGFKYHSINRQEG